jgi:hypothetical protein
MYCRGVSQSRDGVLYSRFHSIVNGRRDVFAKYRKLQSNIRLVSRKGDSSNVNEQIQINDNIYIYDEINDLDLDESYEMDNTNTLNHELTNAASIIDITMTLTTWV